MSKISNTLGVAALAGLLAGGTAYAHDDHMHMDKGCSGLKQRGPGVPAMLHNWDAHRDDRMHKDRMHMDKQACNGYHDSGRRHNTWMDGHFYHCELPVKKDGNWN